MRSESEIRDRIDELEDIVERPRSMLTEKERVELGTLRWVVDEESNKPKHMN